MSDGEGEMSESKLGSEEGGELSPKRGGSNEL